MPAHRLKNSRFSNLFIWSAIALSIFTITRMVLLGASLDVLDMGLWNVLTIFLWGFVNDLITISYCWLPWLAYWLILPSSVFRSRIHGLLAYLFYFCSFVGLLVIAVAEFLFWREFGARFNFISVDYLIYSREVTGNIVESYPVLPLLILVVLIASALMLSIPTHIARHLAAGESLRFRVAVIACLLIVPWLSFTWVKEPVSVSHHNRYHRELALNGIYQFFHAFNSNELNYRDYYLVKDDALVSENLMDLVMTDHQRANSSGLFHIERDVSKEGGALKHNVFLVVVESLSAEYVGFMGNKEHLTENLDRIASKSMVFTDFYATGTRTVRGLEAITLSVPPTPGRSIIKRPDNSGLFSLGSVFAAEGYDVKFIYGGYGYFDNMNVFFAGNGFQIVDRADFSEDEITHANIWGVADENLYAKAIRKADQSYAEEKPFFSLLMTTSNHRPYTYPDKRIDIAAGTGRRGAVKYTDWAIGDFIRQAGSHPWFDDTLFVIVADHTAGSAGKTALPVNSYHIPFLIYCEQHIALQRISTLSSQIDLAPTLLALLHFTYESRFFGRDILTMQPRDERALIANYQRLGLLTRDRLTILSPKRKVEIIKYPFFSDLIETPRADDTQLDIISWYQGADYIYQNRLSSWEKTDRGYMKKLVMKKLVAGR